MEKNADLREQIFFRCAGQRLPILRMQQSHASLEEVFLELTGEKNPVNESMEESMEESPEEPMEEPVKESMKGYAEELMEESAKESMKGYAEEIVEEPVEGGGKS